MESFRKDSLIIDAKNLEYKEEDVIGFGKLSINFRRNTVFTRKMVSSIMNDTLLTSDGQV